MFVKPGRRLALPQTGQGTRWFRFHKNGTRSGPLPALMNHHSSWQKKNLEQAQISANGDNRLVNTSCFFFFFQGGREQHSLLRNIGRETLGEGMSRHANQVGKKTGQQGFSNSIYGGFSNSICAHLISIPDSRHFTRMCTTE